MVPSWVYSSTAALVATATILVFTIFVMCLQWMARPPSKGGNARLHTTIVTLLVLWNEIFRYFKLKPVLDEERKRGSLQPSLRLLAPSLFIVFREKLGDMELPNGVKTDNLKALRTKLKLHPTDVFVVGHAKSGTTWMVQIAKLIRDNGVESGKHVDDVFPFVDPMTLEEVEALPSPRGLKTHLPYDHLPGGDVSCSPAKYIYIYRNPKDRMVSMYHMAKGFYSPFTWDAFFEMQKTGFGKLYSDPLNHVLKWWKQRDLPNVFVICYEDMVKDSTTAIERIAKFLGYDLSAEIIAKIAEQVQFKYMKNVSTVNMSWTDRFRVDKSCTFMRKGIIGDWRNHFTQEQSAHIDAEIAKKIPKDSGLVFDFGEDN